ncbi:MAG TPA: TetR/AcrR family transcriptional regulator [Ktedonobacteraceae bacterium]|jgi:AcrR family transcriptional regulator
MARTPKAVEDRREQIIDAALHVFSRKGFTKATNKDIAHEAGITPGLIYYYFESKEALFNALIEDRSPLRLLTSLPEWMFELPPEQFLRQLLKQLFNLLESEDFAGLIRALVPEVVHGDNPYLREALSSILQRGLSIVRVYFDAKAQRGELRPLDGALTDQVLIGCIMGFILRRQLFRDPSALALTHEQIIDGITETILKGMLPR